MYKVSIVALAFCVITSLLMIVWIIPSYAPPYPGYGIAASTIPYILSITILILAAYNLVITLIRKTGKGRPTEMTSRAFVKLLLFAIPLFLTMPAMELFGFIPVGIVLMGLLMVLMDERRPLYILITAVTTTAVLYVAFWYGLRVLLPSGTVWRSLGWI